MNSTARLMHLRNKIFAKIKKIAHIQDVIPTPTTIFRQIYTDMKRVHLNALMGMVILAGLTLVGCQGCGSGKVTSQDKKELDTIAKEKVV
jgi:hypothetical protein